MRSTMSLIGRAGRIAGATDVGGGRPPGAPARRGYRRRSASHVFAAVTSSVPGARVWVRERLTEAGISAETRSRVELLVSELATNAVQHARGARFVVWLRADERVEIAVRDDEPVSPRPRDAAPEDAGGRGLALVDAVADAWGTSPACGGKWVWCRLSLT